MWGNGQQDRRDCCIVHKYLSYHNKTEVALVLRWKGKRCVRESAEKNNLKYSENRGKGVDKQAGD